MARRSRLTNRNIPKGLTATSVDCSLETPREESQPIESAVAGLLPAIMTAIKDALARGEPAGTMEAYQSDIRVVVLDNRTQSRALYGLDVTTGKLRFFRPIKR